MGVGVQVGDVIYGWCGEGVMQGDVVLFFFVLFEYWEVGDLQWCLVVGDQVEVFVGFQVQCVYEVGDFVVVIGIEEYDVVVVGVNMGDQCSEGGFVEEFLDW